MGGDPQTHARGMGGRFPQGDGSLQSAPTLSLHRVLYENRSRPLLARRKFYHRMARSVTVAMVLLGGSLLIGMAGYHVFEHLGWVDSFANASMILSGMGPLGELKTAGGKIFAGCYALFSGVAFLTSVAVVFAPLYHRFLKNFNLKREKKK